MKTHRITPILLVVALICTLCGCYEQKDKTVRAPDKIGSFDFIVLKSGQADAIFMETENSSIILDCGEKDDGDELVELLSGKGILNVDYIFITHFDKDHVGGFPEVMESITASNIIVPDYIGNNNEYAAFVETVEDRNLEVTVLSEDFSFTLDNVLFEISVPKKKDYAEEDNDFSLVMSVTHGENTFLFTGDAEADRLTEVMSEFGWQYDFLKVPHHGKFNEVTQQFINTIKPQYAVITDSDKNPAEQETTSLLKKLGSSVYSTRDGDIFVVSDGKEIKIVQ